MRLNGRRPAQLLKHTQACMRAGARAGAQAQASSMNAQRVAVWHLGGRPSSAVLVQSARNGGPAVAAVRRGSRRSSTLECMVSAGHAARISNWLLTIFQGQDLDEGQCPVLKALRHAHGGQARGVRGVSVAAALARMPARGASPGSAHDGSTQRRRSHARADARPSGHARRLLARPPAPHLWAI